MQTMNHLNPDPAAMIQGLTEDLVETVYSYSDAMHVATALGCMVFAMLQIVRDQQEQDDDATD